MSSLLRSLLLSFLGGTLLSVVPICAAGPPPLPFPPPRPNSVQNNSQNSTQLEGLRASFSVANPTLSQTPQENVRTHEQLHPPRPISQTSFATRPISPPPTAHREDRGDELFNGELAESAFFGREYDDDDYEELADLHHEMLDRQLSSNKTSRTGSEDTEGDESEAGGWKNKLVKPDITPILSIGGSLLIVIAAFFLLAILFRKVSPKGSRPLPKEAFECLGRYYLTQKHQVQVLRLGSRIVLVSVMPDGVSTLAEITDPDEAVSFLGLCRRLDSNSATEMFRKTVADMSDEELSRQYERPVVTPRRAEQRRQPTASLDLYSNPDESLASILARGRNYER